ncbi:MAG: SDR family oxidoreductase [Caulobacteraceae bacterium]
MFEQIGRTWGGLDFLLHSIAFAPKEDLHRRIVDCSAEGFAMAMDISCHSFIRMARLAEPLMTGGGCLLTVDVLRRREGGVGLQPDGPGEGGAGKLGALHGAQLGEKRIRVHALSPGPLKTRAASGIDRFDELLDRARLQAPEHQLATIEDVGALAAFLVSDAAAALTGNVEYVDAGFHIVA